MRPAKEFASSLPGTKKRPATERIERYRLKHGIEHQHSRKSRYTLRLLARASIACSFRLLWQYLSIERQKVHLQRDFPLLWSSGLSKESLPYTKHYISLQGSHEAFLIPGKLVVEGTAISILKNC